MTRRRKDRQSQKQNVAAIIILCLALLYCLVIWFALLLLLAPRLVFG